MSKLPSDLNLTETSVPNKRTDELYAELIWVSAQVPTTELDSLFLVQPITERITSSNTIRFISMDSASKILSKKQISQFPQHELCF